MLDDASLVAIVDDEESIRRALLRLLGAANYRAEAFGSATAFLDSLVERVPRCVILDLHMPVMTGIELQQHLLQLHCASAVIVITAYDQPGMRERCFELGAKHYFRKPVDGNELLRSIRRLVEVAPAR